MFAKMRGFVSAVTALASPYWVSEERWRARGLLCVIVAMNLGLVYVSVLFSNWNNRFYDALQQRDFARFSHELGYFCVLAAAFIVIERCAGPCMGVPQEGASSVSPWSPCQN